MSGRFRIVVLASGSGSNLQAILDRVHGRDGIEVAGVGSDKPDARALDRAAAADVPSAVFPGGDYESRAQRDAALGAWIDELGADLVVLAGYMQLLSGTFVQRFAGHIINVHPALLPSFPGLDAIGQALEHGAKVTGVTVHFVDEGVDSGPILAQRAVPIGPARDRAALEREIHAVEHELLPGVIRAIASGRVSIASDNPRLVRVEGESDE